MISFVSSRSASRAQASPTFRLTYLSMNADATASTRSAVEFAAFCASRAAFFQSGGVLAAGDLAAGFLAFLRAPPRSRSGYRPNVSFAGFPAAR